jgi:hypothetical protein
LVTWTVFEEGFPPPSVELKLSPVLDKTIVGAVGGVPTVNVTAMVCGLLLAAAEVTLTLAVYVPAARVPAVGVSVSVLGAAGALSVALSQPVGCPAP